MSLAAFASQLERLAFTPQRLGKERLLARAFTENPDPERGLMLAALTGDLKLRQVTPSLLRGLKAAGPTRPCPKLSTNSPPLRRPGSPR